MTESFGDLNSGTREADLRPSLPSIRSPLWNVPELLSFEILVGPLLDRQSNPLKIEFVGKEG